MPLCDPFSQPTGLRDVTCFPARFAAVAADFPEAVAVADGRCSLSYRELELRSRQVAGILLAQGIGAGSTVGVWMLRTVDLWVALLGVLRAGAAYLPLERDWPLERLHYMYERAGAAAVVCDDRSDVPSFVPESGRIRISADLQPEPLTLPRINPDQTAYVIYTSGSTGNPKGVAISHGSLANLLAAMADMLHLSPTDAQLCITALSFDLVIPDLFLPLTVGARCVITSRKLAADAVLLAETLEHESITVLQATPHTFKRLLASGWQGKLSLTAVIGGEQVAQSLADTLAERVGVLWHCYGPTEATVWATSKRLGDGECVTLGEPLPGYALHVLDEQDRPLEGEGEGQLCIGGVGVALGYINEPELTAAKFVGLAGKEGRFYRTGDLVRRQVDGGLVFLGRIDHQVKVGGYRVELGEIESLALALPGVEDAAAVVDHGDNGPGIALYYTVAVDAGSEVDQAIRQCFERKLPWYMLPSHLIAVERMPLTPGGKIDRRALRKQPIHTEPKAGPSFLREQLLRVWQEAFPDRRVVVTDNFFDLGGDSLAAVQLLTAIDQLLNLDLTLSFVYAYPSVTLMAERLSIEAGIDVLGSTAGGIVCLRPGDTDRLYCFHPVGGSVMHYRALLDHVPREVGVYGVEAAGLDGVTPVATDLETMAAGYAERLQAMHSGGPYLLAGGSMGGVIALEVARCLSAKGCEIAAVLMFDSLGPDAVARNNDHRRWTASRLIYSLGQRVKNRWQLLYGQFMRWRQRPIPHTYRYRFIELQNLQVLHRYFTTARSRQPWKGHAILIRLPQTASGCYANLLLGWETVLDPDRVTVEFVNGNHQRLVESPAFGTALQRQLERVLNSPEFSRRC